MSKASERTSSKPSSSTTTSWSVITMKTRISLLHHHHHHQHLIIKGTTSPSIIHNILVGGTLHIFSIHGTHWQNKPIYGTFNTKHLPVLWYREHRSSIPQDSWHLGGLQQVTKSNQPKLRSVLGVRPSFSPPGSFKDLIKCFWDRSMGHHLVISRDWGN